MENTGPLRAAGRRAVVGRGPRAAGPLGRGGPWAAGRWAAGLLLVKPVQTWCSSTVPGDDFFKYPGQNSGTVPGCKVSTLTTGKPKTGRPKTIHDLTATEREAIRPGGGGYSLIWAI